MRVFSFGGGVQSMAALVLSARKQLPYTHFLFADVGADSENPDTLAYIDAVARPYAREHGLQIIDVKRVTRSGDDALTLYQDAMQDTGNVSLPVFMLSGAPGSRNCTSKWKIAVVEKWMRQNAGASKANRQPLGIGISVDEYHRMRTDDPEREPYIIKEYPLIELYLTRAQCQQIITNAGLPLAPKSSCWFCPYKRKSEWVRLRSDKPELFNAAVALEDRLNEKRAAMGKDRVFLTATGKPLGEAIPLASMNMFADDDDPMGCESGYCMT